MTPQSLGVKVCGMFFPRRRKLFTQPELSTHVDARVDLPIRLDLEHLRLDLEHLRLDLEHLLG